MKPHSEYPKEALSVMQIASIKLAKAAETMKNTAKSIRECSEKLKKLTEDKQ